VIHSILMTVSPARLAKERPHGQVRNLLHGRTGANGVPLFRVLAPCVIRQTQRSNLRASSRCAVARPAQRPQRLPPVCLQPHQGIEKRQG
jgi:hypothetical protein